MLIHWKLPLNPKKYKLISRDYNETIFATCSNDGKIYIFYYKIEKNKFIDPILIPLKILYCNNRHRYLDIKFHPELPWLFASSSDGVTRLYTEL